MNAVEEATANAFADYTELRRAVEACAKVVNNRTSVPILGNLLITGNAGGLSEINLRATDLEIIVDASAVAEVFESFAVTIPAKPLLEFLKSTAPGLVEIRVQESHVVIYVNGINRKFPTLPADEFPNIQIDGKEQFALSATIGRLQALLVKVDCASRDEARGAVLMGTLLDLSNDGLQITSTDGYHLGRGSMIVSGGTEGKHKVILPGSFVNLIRKLKVPKAQQDEPVSITVFPKHAALHVEALDQTFITRVVDGTYPNCDVVIPAGFEYRAECDLAQFLSVVKNAKAAAGDRANMVRLTFDGPELTINAHSEASGSFSGSVPLGDDHFNMDQEIGFNADMLLHLGTTLLKGASRIKIETNGPLSPGKFTDPDNVGPFIIVMPLRTK